MSDLVTGGLLKAGNDALVQMAGDINILKLFATDFSTDIQDVGTGVLVPVVQYSTGAYLSATYGTAAGAEFNADSNNYENSNGGFRYESVTLTNQPKTTIEINRTDVLNNPNAPFWNRVGEGIADTMGSAISKSLGGLFTTTACTGGKITLSSVTKTALAKLRESVKGRVADTVIGLSPDYYATALSLFDTNVLGSDSAVVGGSLINGLYGFRAIVCMKDLPTGIKGVALGKGCLAAITRGAPVADPSVYQEFGTVADPSGFGFSVSRHTSAATGKGYINASMCYGLKICQPEFVQYIAAS